MTATVKNTETDARKYAPGDFVHWLLNDRTPSVGIATSIDGDALFIRHFEGGFPFDVSKNPVYGMVGKATKAEVLDHFHATSERFEKEIRNGGLPGAIAARRQHYLKGVIANLDTMAPLDAATRRPPEPETGTYVAMGVYSGQGPSEHLEGLVAVPRLAEGAVSRILVALRPNGFGNIPGEVHNTPATSHGDLVAYWVYEAPERATSMVLNPAKLEVRLLEATEA